MTNPTDIDTTGDEEQWEDPFAPDPHGDPFAHKPPDEPPTPTEAAAAEPPAPPAAPDARDPQVDQPPADELAAGDDDSGFDDDDEWSFDLDDIAPETDSLGEALDSDELMRLQREREQQKGLEHRRRREVEKQMDEEGRQRRQNVRVMVQYPVTLRVAGHPGVKVRSRDLSATGVGFATRLPLDLEAAGTVTIHFPEWNFTKDIVVRFVKPILAGRQVGAQFTELSAEERERVVKEVFAVQRSQLQEQRARGK